MTRSKEKQLVTNKALLLATIIAITLAVLLYFIVVLPAEYHKDPTGLGGKLGLMALSNPASQLTDVTKPLETKTLETREDQQIVKVPPHRGVEYKFNINQFGKIKYEWATTNGSEVYFDFHGEPEGDTTGFFESYSIASTNEMKGTATVPFKGSHGWYWKNTTDDEVEIELKTSGEYLVIGLKK